MDKGMETILRMIAEHNRGFVREIRKRRMGLAVMHIGAAMALVVATGRIVAQGAFRPSERQIRRFAGLIATTFRRHTMLLTRNGAHENPPARELRQVCSYVDRRLKVIAAWLAGFRR